MATPEGRIKNNVKRVLKSFGDELYSHWPVLNGMGMPTLDCIVCYCGQYIGIETKAPGKKPTPRQELTMSQMRKAGGIVFVVSTDQDVERLHHSLSMLKWSHHKAEETGK